MTNENALGKLLIGIGVVGVLDFVVRGPKSLVGMMIENQKPLPPLYDYPEVQQSTGYSQVPPVSQVGQKNQSKIVDTIKAVLQSVAAVASKKKAGFPLKKGSEGYEVLLLQKHLGITGTGRFDKSTEQALYATYQISRVNNQSELDRILGIKTYTPAYMETKQPIMKENPYYFVAAALFNERYNWSLNQDKWVWRNNIDLARVKGALGYHINSLASIELIAQEYRRYASYWGMNLDFHRDFKGVLFK